MGFAKKWPILSKGYLILLSSFFDSFCISSAICAEMFVDDLDHYSGTLPSKALL
jgi:hypothetical protein